MKKPLIILTGPTAVGKTETSIALAKAVNGEIISTDSMQVYKHMDIGSAKITKEEMEGVKHYLIDELEPDVEFNVVRFKEYAGKYMEEIYAKGKIPIIVGGTGFYIQSVLYDIDFTTAKEDTSYRKKLETFVKNIGAGQLHDMLRKVDEASADAIHPNNVKRVIRALEYYKQTGQKISEHNEEQRQKESPYQYAYFVLNDIRESLYRHIDLRIEKMLQKGLLDEVKGLKEKGYTNNMVSMQGLGYKELLGYLDQTYSYEEAVYILKRDTRHFAKRQITWFKREPDVIWVDKNNFDYDKELVLKYMIQILRDKGII